MVGEWDGKQGVEKEENSGNTRNQHRIAPLPPLGVVKPSALLVAVNRGNRKCRWQGEKMRLEM